VGNDYFSKNLSLWSQSGFTNRQKMFFFKFYNNTLGINVRTAHFVPQGTRLCFFCSKKRPNERQEETFIHLFYQCRTVHDWHVIFINKFLPELPNLDNYNLKSLWLLGYYDNLLYNSFFSAAIMTFQFCIWECKLKKLIPSFHTLQCQFLELFSQSFKHNSDFRKASLKINYNLCRILLGDRRVDHDGDE
jgi:hypothetical protein